MRAALVLLCFSALFAQMPPAGSGTGDFKPKQLLSYSGKPLQVEFVCSAQEMKSLGLSCPADHPCTVYLELVEMGRAGERIFLTGNFHTGTSTLSSVLLASEDNGKTWSEPYERIPHSGLEQIHFQTLAAGWISGQVLEPLPRDPFLLITGDGGRTWRKRAIWDDSRAGAIDFFWFDSLTHGLLWIDRGADGDAGRYEYYESMTGGENWAIRQAGNRPVRRPEKAVHVPDPDWRLRADGASSSYRIERRTGNWQTVASFLIRAGECREREPTLQSPPLEEPGEAAGLLVAPKPAQKAPTLKKSR